MRELPAAPVIPLSLGGPAHALATIRTQGLPGTDEPEARAWAVLHQVLDPEVPALSVCDLGIVRELRFEPAAGLAVEPAGPSLDGQLTVKVSS